MLSNIINTKRQNMLVIKNLKLSTLILLICCGTSTAQSLKFNKVKALMLHNAVNQTRINNNLAPLEFDENISLVAEQHSNYLKANNTVNHYKFKKRSILLKYFFKLSAIAENCHKFWNFRPEIIVDDFMKSSGHKKNILGDFTHTGIAIIEREDGTDFITQIFVKITQKD